MDRPSPRLPPTNARPSQTLTHTLPGHREEPRDKTRKAVSYFFARVLTIASCEWNFRRHSTLSASFFQKKKLAGF